MTPKALTRVALILFFVMTSNRSQANAQQDFSLSLTDVILRAERYSPNVKAAEANENAAKQNIRCHGGR
jgi:hypothetical protein